MFHDSFHHWSITKTKNKKQKTASERMNFLTKDGDSNSSPLIRKMEEFHRAYNINKAKEGHEKQHKKRAKEK